MAEFLFVYGTLKKDEGNHHVLGENPKFICEGIVKGHAIHEGPGFPYAVINSDYQVKGELYEIENLKYTDQLEGYPHHYDRHLVRVDVGEYYAYDAWMYISRRIHNTPIITTGEW